MATLTSDAPESRTLLIAGRDSNGNGPSLLGRRAVAGRGRVAAVTAAVAATIAALVCLALPRSLDYVSRMRAAESMIEQPPGAISGDAVPFKNIHLVMRGYNVFFADPAPPSPSDGAALTMDPGLRKPVFDLAYGRGELTGDRRRTQPDGYHATVDTGCSMVFVSKSIRDEYEFTQEMETEIGLTAGVEASVGVTVSFPPPGDGSSDGPDVGVSAGAALSAGASGTLSHTNKEIRTESELREQRMERSVAKCASYVAAIEFGDFPKTHPEFQKAVDGLAGAGAEKFWDLFDDFGTHFLTSVKMGARSTVTSYFKREEYETMKSTIKGLGVSVGVAASATAGVAVGVGDAGTGKGVSAGIGASASLLSPPEQKAVETMKKYTTKQDVSYMGPRLEAKDPGAWWQAVSENPVPIRFDKREICLHPAFDGDARSKCVGALKGYCNGRLAAQGAPCGGIEKRECLNDLECAENHVCREYRCIAEPVCEVTLCERGCSGSSSYLFPGVTASKAPNGRIFDLENGNWWNRVESIRLSPGCRFVEAVDDDGACVFGKGDNGRYSASATLPYDLQHDVCMLRVFAKEVPRLRRLEAANSSSDMPRLAEPSGRLPRQRRLKASPAALRSPTPSFASASVSSPEVGNQSRRLRSEEKPQYMRNIGKAMYGYNHFFGAPLSAEFAGTDPGFVHRALWADTYTRGAKATIEDISDLAVFTGRSSGSGGGSNSGAGSAGKKMPSDGDSGDGYTALKGYYLAGYAAGESTQRGSTEAKARCVELGSQCGGITCNSRGESCTCRAGTTPFPSPSGEVTYQKPSDGYTRLTGYYLGGYAAGDSTQRGVEASKRRCNDLGSRCGGITCDRAGASCTCRASTTAQQSPTGELTYQKLPSEDYQKYTGYYLAGYAGGDSRSRGVEASKAKCKEMGSRCGGVTCNKAGSSCTLRGATTPKPSPSGEVTYKKLTGRRLKALAPRLAAGPPRSLQEQSAPKVPDGWRVRMARSTVCERDFSTKEIKSSFAYQHEMADSMSLGLDIGFVSFGYSSEAKEFVGSNGKQKKMLVATKAECADYIAELDEKNPPPTNPAFEFVVKATKIEQEFYAVFDMFGLSYATSVLFGARYGFTRYIDEQNYQSFQKDSQATSVSVAVSYTVGVDKGGVSAGVTLSAEVAATEKKSSAVREAVSKHFSEVKEFSLGKRMPDKGGVSAWIADASGEPMPIRYALKSICEHPAFAGKKGDCDRYRATYCTKHLQHMDEGISCLPEAEPKCLWDIDCGAHQSCEEGSCVSQPDCWVRAYSGDNLNGWSSQYGPIYYDENPTGQIFSLGSMGRSISSVEVSGGCEEVVLMDEDACRVQYSDNMVVELRRSNGNRRVTNLPYDLDNDVCKMKLSAKKQWVK